MNKKETLIIQPFQATGNVYAAASKSAMQRICALALLHDGKTNITNKGISNDDLAALDIIQQLGASVEVLSEKLVVKGVKEVFGHQIHAGESGLSVRMFTPIAALSKTTISITGNGSLLKRPLDIFEEIFPALGVKIETNNGKLPLQIEGPMIPADIQLDGSLSSQFLTGFLIAFAHAATKPVTITVQDLKSRPYIDLTLSLMEKFGHKVVNQNYQDFKIEPGIHYTDELNIAVEGDWSGAAFLLVAGAIGGEVFVKGLEQNSTQGDKRITEALEMAGANLSWNGGEISVSRNNLHAFNFDATDCPDLFPPLVSLASCSDGVTIIQGAERLTHKESNRAITLQQEFGKMGVLIELEGDTMKVHGSKDLKGGTFDTHEDHRIAMALAIMATVTKEPIILEDARVVNKSYPQFYNHLEQLGGEIKELK